MSREEAFRKNQEGLRLFQAGKYEEALKLFNEALEIDSELASAWLNRSDVYKQLGREAEADADKEKWESLKPTLADETPQTSEKSILRALIGDVRVSSYYTLREDLCTQLRSIGVDARLSELLRVFKDIERGLLDESGGLIEINDSVIRWVYMIERGTDTSEYYVKYVVADSLLGTNCPGVKITSKLKGDKWQWKGKDSGLGIIERLNNDTLTNSWLVHLNSEEIKISDEITIRAYSKGFCWIISSKTTAYVPLITEELWDCYQAIAHQLLSAPL